MNETTHQNCDASGDPLVDEINKVLRQNTRKPEEADRYKEELDLKFSKGRVAAEAKEMAELKKNALEAIRRGKSR
jgi:hypothetical protein